MIQNAPIRPPLFVEGGGPETARLDPSDPCVTWSDCYYTPAGWQYDEGFPVWMRNSPFCMPRAAIQRYVATDLDVDFGYVRILARWGRIYTRQQVWDNGGSERWLDLWLHKHHVGYYFKEAAYYYDAEYSLPPAQRRVPQVPEVPKQPPAEWLPQDDLPCWELCTPYVAGATPIYIAETM